MPWAIAIKNIEAGKMELVCGDLPSLDDPRYEDVAHIVPVPEEADVMNFGVHDFTKDCCCHPKVEHFVHNRTLISHREAVN